MRESRRGTIDRVSLSSDSWALLLTSLEFATQRPAPGSLLPWGRELDW